MKVLSMILLVTLVCCTTIRHTNKKVNEGKLNCKSIGEFKGDTLSYVRYNFKEQKNQYLGKPASLIFDNLQFEIKSYLPFHTLDNGDSIDGMYISSYSRLESSKRTFDELKMVELILYFKKSLPMDSIRHYYGDRKSAWNWNPQLKAYFGKQIIKDVNYFAHQ